MNRMMIWTTVAALTLGTGAVAQSNATNAQSQSQMEYNSNTWSQADAERIVARCGTSC